MTVTYTAEVATCRKFGSFIKLLARWRGSIYKLMYMDVLLFLTLYYTINMIYIYLLEDDSKKTFESVVYYCASYTSLIPLSFVLGFYVNLVMSRWWDQYITIPWPDSIAVFVSAHVHGLDEGGRVMRRTVMRYVCLCITIVFTMISPCCKKRFPTLKHLVDAGLLLENEKAIIETMDKSFPKYPKHWMPIVWAASIITRARKEGRIRDDFAVKTIIDELNSFRGRAGTLMYYDFISIPLVYTQVVTIAVYSFFVCTLLAHQWTESKRDTYEALDFYAPIFITLQFFFYMGWLKVAETLINPFGEDDDDFEVNWMIDRNLQVSYLIVDEMHHEHPELVKDQYWDEIYPNELPYESEVKREYPPEPSTAKYDLEASAASKNLSPTGSMSEKNNNLLQNAFNQRSLRFNETFQRFGNITEEDLPSQTPFKPISAQISLQSIADIESIENITTFTNMFDVESQREREIILHRTRLEPVIEEIEHVSEIVGEEELSNVEEEEEQEEEETPKESDSDEDPFERLRIERQQQRIEHMNNYVQRYFGSNFQIVLQSLAKPEQQISKQTKEKEIYGDSEEVDKDEITEEPTLVDQDIENSTHLKKMVVTWYPENIEYSISDIPETSKVDCLQMPTETTNDFEQTNDLQTAVRGLTRATQTSELSLAEEQNLFLEGLKSDSKSLVTNALAIDGSHFSEPLNLAATANYPGEQELLWLSKATSPMGSARSMSTQSSTQTEEWELLEGSSPIVGEHRVNIEEEPNEKESHSKSE